MHTRTDRVLTLARLTELQSLAQYQPGRLKWMPIRTVAITHDELKGIISLLRSMENQVLANQQELNATKLDVQYAVDQINEITSWREPAERVEP